MNNATNTITSVKVSDPVQHSEGMNKYTSYRVDVRSSEQPNTINNPDDVFQNAGYSAVLRRYSDFLWLYTRLHKEKAGGVIPPLPEKQAVARFSSSFIEERRAKLEQFLRRVAVHPELYDAPSLDTFLRADDVTFHAAKNVKGQGDSMMMSVAAYPSISPTLNAPPKKDGIKKWFAETKTSIAGDLVRSPDDDLFLEVERYIERLEKQMKNVSLQASNLVKKGKEISNGLFEFGLAFNILGQSEADELGNALVKMGATADELSTLTMEEAEKEMIEFDEPLKDYIKTIHAVKLALQRRHEKRLTYTTCLSEVTVKRANVHKFRSTPGSEAKAYGAEMSLKRGEVAADAARDEFATVSQRVLREVDRFKREKGDEMKRVVLAYITAQIEYNKKMEQVWANLLPQMESLAVSSTDPNVNGNTNGNVHDNTNGNATNGEPNGTINENGTHSLPETAPSNIEGEVEDMAQPMHQHQHHHLQHSQQASSSHIYQAGLSHNQNMIGVEGSGIQYRDMNAYPGYSNMSRT
jgi:sorting nexin-1/2